MNMNSECVKAERTLQIPQQLDELAFVVEVLGTDVDTLVQRLEKVSHAPVEEKGEVQCTPVLCDYAENISDKVRKLQSIKYKLERLLGCLEL